MSMLLLQKMAKPQGQPLIPTSHHQGTCGGTAGRSWLSLSLSLCAHHFLSDCVPA